MRGICFSSSCPASCVCVCLKSWLPLLGRSLDPGWIQSVLIHLICFLSFSFFFTSSSLLSFFSSLPSFAAIRKSHPHNLTAKYFTAEYYDSLDEKSQREFLKITKSGLENPDSTMGCYAMNPGASLHYKNPLPAPLPTIACRKLATLFKICLLRPARCL